MRAIKWMPAILLLQALTFNLYGQEAQTANGNEYTFTISQGTYSELSGGTQATEDVIWNSLIFSAPIGFDFQLYDEVIDTLYGLGAFEGAVSSSPTLDTNHHLISVCRAELIDRGAEPPFVGHLSPVIYSTEGQPGQRIFKLEWNNAGFFLDLYANNQTNFYVNFQLWLYEGTNEIEMHYGPNFVPSIQLAYQATGPMIGLANRSFSDVYLLSGAVGDPNLSDTIVYVTGTPDNGTIYRFSKTPSSIKEQDIPSFKIYPNPTSDKIEIAFSKQPDQGSRVYISDLTGKELLSIDLKDSNTAINTQFLAPGIYNLSFVNGNGQALVRKFVKL